MIGKKFTMIQKTHKLDFGKHKGKTIEEILECDPTYIRWAIKTISGFELSEEDTKFALELAYKADCSVYEDYYGAIDIYDYCD